MVEAVRSSETSVNLYETTRRNMDFTERIIFNNRLKQEAVILLMKHRTPETLQNLPVMISGESVLAIEWRCWTRMIRHLSYFSAYNMETEAVRIKEKEKKSYQFRGREILVLHSVREINDYCAIHHFFLAFYSVLLYELNCTSASKP
jgi:hypothetical protein